MHVEKLAWPSLKAAKIEYTASFPESLYEPLIWDSEEVSASTSLTESKLEVHVRPLNITNIIFLTLVLLKVTISNDILLLHCFKYDLWIERMKPVWLHVNWIQGNTWTFWLCHVTALTQRPTERSDVRTPPKKITWKVYIESGTGAKNIRYPIFTN